MIRALLLFMCIALTGCVSSPVDLEQYESHPIVKAELQLNVASPEQLQQIFGPFAERCAYTLRIARLHPSEPRFSIMMWRQDSIILASNPFGPYRFNIYRAKTNPISQESAERLGQLLSAAGPVPNNAFKRTGYARRLT